MGCALGLDQTAIQGMRLRQSFQRFGDGVQDHGQFVVELVSGGSHHGCGAIGFGISLHVRMIGAGERTGVRRCAPRVSKR